MTLENQGTGLTFSHSGPQGVTEGRHRAQNSNPAFLSTFKDISLFQVWYQGFKHCLITVLIPLPCHWQFYCAQLSVSTRDNKSSGCLTGSSHSLLSLSPTLVMCCFYHGQVLGGNLEWATAPSLPAPRGSGKAQLGLEDGLYHGINICTYNMFVNLVSS